MSILDKYNYLFEKPLQKKVYLDLKRIKCLLKKLNNSENKLKNKGVLVAGTNGKGSTCASLQSILTQAGYKVGLFTSPHLVNLTERIRINYKDISEKKLADYFEKVLPFAKQVEKEIHDSPTWFEMLTCIAILYFLDEKVDLVVFEVGLGGRLDATNVLNLGINVIADISIDHSEFLGKTIEKITAEKAGIIKQNSIVLTSNKGKCLNVIKKVCTLNKAKLILAEKISDNYKLKLLGEHQRRNAGLTLTVIKNLRKKGYKISDLAIRQGFLKVKWPGRFQILNYKLKMKNLRIIVDGAHNPAGFIALVKTFKEQGFKKAIVLFAAKKTKDAEANLKILTPIIEEIYFPKLTELNSMHRPEKLRQICSAGKITGSLTMTIKKAENSAFDKELPVLVCGSLYFIGLLSKRKLF